MFEVVILAERGEVMLDRVGTALEDLVEVSTERGRGRAGLEVAVVGEKISEVWRE